MLWIVFTKTVPNTAASQTSVDWGHDEAWSGGTAQIPRWYVLLVYLGVFVFLMVVCKLDTLSARSIRKRCSSSNGFLAMQSEQCEGSIAAVLTSTHAPQSSWESRCW